MITESQRTAVRQQQAQLARSLDDIQRYIDQINPPEQRKQRAEMQRRIDALWPPEHRQNIKQMLRSVVPPGVYESARRYNDFMANNPAVIKAMAEAAELDRRFRKGPIPSNIRIPG